MDRVDRIIRESIERFLLECDGGACGDGGSVGGSDGSTGGDGANNSFGLGRDGSYPYYTVPYGYVGRNIYSPKGGKKKKGKKKKDDKNFFDSALKRGGAISVNQA